MALKETVHLAFAAAFLFAAYYDLNVLRIPDVFREHNERSWGRSKYLSFWNLYLQAAFFATSFLNDVLRNPDLTRLLDAAFANLCFPVAMIVSFSFGLVFAIDRELAYPLMFDTFVPFWLTFVIHGLILPAALVEMLVVKHGYSRGLRGQVILGLFIVINIGWVVYVGHTCQFFAYPSLEPLTITQQVAVVLATGAFTQLPYRFGTLLHYLKWGQKSALKSKKMQ